MKLKLAVLLLAAILCLGCATTGSAQTVKTTVRMQTVQDHIRQAVAQVEATGASLGELLKQDQTDLKKAYAAYTANVAKMETIGILLDKHTNQINSLGKDYFAEWEKIGGLSEQRRADLGAVYDRIPQASIGVMSGLHAYMSYLLETQMYLSRNLTPKGIEAIAPVARKAITEGGDLKDAAKRLLSAMDRAKAELAQGNNQGSAR